MLVTRSRVRRRVAALAAVPALLVATRATGPEPMAPGITYSFRMTSQMIEANGKTKELSSMTGRGQVGSNSARFEIVSVKGAQAEGQQSGFGGKGSYMLFTEGGKTMTIVDPENKQYYEMDLTGMMRMLSAMGPIMKIEISDVSFDATPMGAGETIEGYATQKYQLVSKYKTKVSVIGIKQETNSADTATYWYAPALKLVGSPFTSAPSIGALVNNPDFDAKLSAAMAKLPKSVPVKMVSRSVSTDKNGKQTTTLTTIEYTEIKRGDVPASAFEIPAGYAKIQGPTLTAEQMDSLQKASAAAQTAGGQQGGEGATDPTGVTDAAKQGAKEGAQEAAKATAKKKIGKIFGRP